MKRESLIETNTSVMMSHLRMDVPPSDEASPNNVPTIISSWILVKVTSNLDALVLRNL